MTTPNDPVAPPSAKRTLSEVLEELCPGVRKRNWPAWAGPFRETDDPVLPEPMMTTDDDAASRIAPPETNKAHICMDCGQPIVLSNGRWCAHPGSGPGCPFNTDGHHPVAPPATKYELCDTVFPSGEKCVRPKDHHTWSKAKCSPTVKFMEYSANTQCEEARMRQIENKRIKTASVVAPPATKEVSGDETVITNCEWYGKSMGQHDFLELPQFGIKRCVKCKIELPSPTPPAAPVAEIGCSAIREGWDVCSFCGGTGKARL